MKTTLAYDGWPVAEVLAGALVVGTFSVVLAAFVRLDAVIPQAAVAAAGAFAGGVVSYALRPRRIAIDRRRRSPDQTHLTRAA